MKKWLAILAVTLVAGFGVFTMVNVSAAAPTFGCELGAPGC